jgi:hypothetical protein
MCDADPGALSKYVIALIKKEKPEDEFGIAWSNKWKCFSRITPSLS